MDPMDFVKQAWSSFSVPTQFAPTLDADELDKRIRDLRSVEQWLALNLSLLRTTIQGLEIQRGTLGAIKAMSESFGKAIQPTDHDTARTVARFAAEAAARQANANPNSGPATSIHPTATAPAGPVDWSPSSMPSSGPAAAGAPDDGAVPPPGIPGVNPLAWWEMLQSNFQQIAKAASGAAAADQPADAATPAATTKATGAPAKKRSTPARTARSSTGTGARKASRSTAPSKRSKPESP